MLVRAVRCGGNSKEMVEEFETTAVLRSPTRQVLRYYKRSAGVRRDGARAKSGEVHERQPERAGTMTMRLTLNSFRGSLFATTTLPMYP